MERMSTIRAIHQEDRSEWLRLRRALWPRYSAAQLEAEMHSLFTGSARQAVFVAERPGGALCGMIELSIRSHAKGCRTKDVGYIEGWYVDPDMRRKGIGGQLVRAGEAWAQGLGCREMASDTTTPDYPISPSAHARLGYEETGQTIHFRKNIT